MKAPRTNPENAAVLPESGVHPLAEPVGPAEERLSRAHRYVMQAAHELLTPLTIIHGEVCLALRRHRQREADQATFEELLDQTRQLISLSQDLLTLASLGVPDSRPSPGSVRITELIERAVEDVESATGVACRVRLDVQDVTIPGSYDDLLRLVRNLLDNAVQYGPSSAVIRVSAECELVQGMLSIAVQDEGPPIPEQIAERIFEPFFRATAVREQPGSGLGLAIAREIAEAHGGSLALDSSADSPRFVVRLPLADRAATSD